MDHIPLSHEASAGDCNKQTTSTLPPEVDNCLVNARFVCLPCHIPYLSVLKPN